jgi:hypothetical protein
LVAVGGDEALVGEGVEDELGGGFHGTVVVGVEADDFGFGVEVDPGLAFDAAEDERREADDADQGGDTAVVAGIAARRRGGARPDP